MYSLRYIIFAFLKSEKAMYGANIATKQCNLQDQQGSLLRFRVLRQNNNANKYNETAKNHVLILDDKGYLQRTQYLDMI